MGDFEEWKTQVDAEALDIKTNVDEHYAKIKERYDKFDGDNNSEILWRLGRAIYKLGAAAEVANDRAKQKKYLLEADTYVARALELDPSSADAHSWRAFISGKMCEILDPREKIKRGHMVKEHLDEAVKIRPNDHSLFYTLGRWSIEVAKLSYIEKKLAALVFQAPPEATYQDAIDNFKKALDLNPDGRACYFYIAQCLIHMKNYKAAIENLDLAVKCTPRDEEDVAVEKEMTQLQAKYAKYR